MISQDIQKRLSEIEYFILLKQKDKLGHPTLIDLTNERVDKMDGQLRELIGQVSAQIDLQNSEQKVLEYRISKLNEQYES